MKAVGIDIIDFDIMVYGGAASIDKGYGDILHKKVQLFISSNMDR